MQFAACSVASCKCCLVYPANFVLPKQMVCRECGRTTLSKYWKFGYVPLAVWYSSNYEMITNQWIDFGRRAVSGTVAASTGIFGLAEGEACVLLFNEDHVFVYFDQSESQFWPFNSITGLDFGGSGESIAKSGGGWGGGGFGLAGFAIGLGVAAALNKATTKTHVMMDSSVTIAAGEKAIVLSIARFDPKTLRAIMDAPMDRIQMSRDSIAQDEITDDAIANGESAVNSGLEPSSRSFATEVHSQRIALLRDLASLRDEGIITDAEFEVQKTQILATE
jgi:hypothetical protein